jgi:hypothetical protein
MRKLVKIFALAALLAPAVASAQLSLGARVGYAFAMGKAVDEDGGDLSDGVKGQIPIQIDVGYRLTPAFTLGGYFSAGYGIVGDAFSDDCDAADIDCSARVLRLGVQLDYAFKNVSPTMTPWLGAGIGYEWATLKGEQGSNEATESYSGFEFLNLQGGVDWKVGQFSVGPFAMLSIAQYSDFDFESPAGDASGDIPNKSIHEWLQIGLRGRFDL